MEITLTVFNEAYRALMVAKDVDEVKQVRDKMEALRLYLKQRGESLEMQNACAEIKLRAERRAGELLKEMPRSNGGRPEKNSSQDETSFEKVITEHDIPKAAAYRFQSIASIPAKIFEQAIAETKTNKEELTSSKFQQIARKVKRQEIYAQKNEAEFPTSKYRVIYADPPWKYSNTMPDYFIEQADHYPPMTVAEIAALPVKEIAEDNAVLFIWITSPILEESFQVINAWGFKYKASFVWDKVKHNMGHYNSVRHEFLLICTKGSCQPDVQKLFDSVQSIERSDVHSEKPEEFRQIIDTIYPHGKRIELFARKQISEWENYGNEF